MKYIINKIPFSWLRESDGMMRDEGRGEKREQGKGPQQEQKKKKESKRLTTKKYY
jgi:hypothetical protein